MVSEIVLLRALMRWPCGRMLLERFPESRFRRQSTVETAKGAETSRDKLGARPESIQDPYVNNV
jgi:hypothetical protein